MSKSLAKAVVIVWSIAIFVGVFLGLPALLTALGVEINLGLIVNAMVATSDRRERKQERDSEDPPKPNLWLSSRSA
ncbi:hypothetical protein, partial [Mycobacterium sp.]|uniref:hypothetical protein n=1 Tax=Mycobacterium sp. TaxID=1785 RepID=UPI002BEDDD48